ncbi:MAG: AmmeMemoRadiSam system protein B [Patescibacteria group bacterium]|nr:AmmeMemoRadiSam system protein B [Patescibacteria group bacterium]
MGFGNNSDIRQPAAAGLFYPEDSFQLQKMVEKFLNKATLEKNINPESLKALIVPHAGYIYSGPTAAIAYHHLSTMNNKPEKIILIGPSHQIPIDTFVFTNLKYWLTPMGKVELLPPPKNCTINNLAFEYEHSLEVQLPFLQKILPSFKILPVLINEINKAEKLAQFLLPILDSQTIIIVSSDLSHYYPLEIAERIDNETHQAILNSDIQKIKNIEACGQAGILTLAFISQEKKWRPHLVSYQTSFEETKDNSNVVGYGAYIFTEK